MAKHIIIIEDAENGGVDIRLIKAVKINEDPKAKTLSSVMADVMMEFASGADKALQTQGDTRCCH